MEVNEEKAKYLSARAAVEDCKRLMSELQKKSDILEESLPSLNQAVEDAEKVKTSALDSFALHSNKESESELRRARQAHEDAQKKHSETHELIEACNRSLKKQESELARLNTACALARRELWQAIADEIKSAIPKHVFGDMKTLFVAGVQCSQTRQFMLDSLFPNIPTDDFQEIRNELVEKYGID